MNYTFLPYSEQRDIKRDYRVRAAIVFLFFLSVAFMAGIASLFPAYIHASVEKGFHLRAVAALRQTSGAAALASAEQSLASSTALMSALSASVTPGPFSQAVEDIAAARGNMSLNSFEVSRSGASGLSISIQGFAPTRDSLIAFKGRLNDLSPGITVTLPVSELAKDANIPFSIQITE